MVLFDYNHHPTIIQKIINVITTNTVITGMSVAELFGSSNIFIIPIISPMIILITGQMAFG